MKRIISLKPSEPVHRPVKRAFLTQRSSWIKLISFAAIFILGSWFIFKPHTETPKNQTVINDKQGKVAGVETSRPNTVSTNSSNSFSTQTGNDHISGGGDSKDASTTVASTQENPPSNQPTKAQLDTTKLIGASNIDDLQTLLENGKKYLDNNQLTQADTLFTRATEVAPEYRTAWYLLGYTQLKEYEKTPTNQDSLSFAQKAVITLTRAHTIDPLADNVNSLLKTAQLAAGINPNS
jgi:hypothetical protein